MTRATLISTMGPYLDAVIEVAGQQLWVTDEFSVDGASAPRPGETFEAELSEWCDEDESWETIFSSNPDRRIGLEPVQGGRIRAFGQIIAVAPVIVDCGLLQAEDVVRSKDPRLIGEFVAFTITRLSAYAVRPVNIRPSDRVKTSG